jgi:hypothetical protein
MGVRACLAVGAESSHVRTTHDSSRMSPRALWAKGAKSPIIVRTLDAPISRMMIETFTAHFAFSSLHEPRANGHGAKVEIVGVFAVIAHLAKIPQVMPANCRLFLAVLWIGGEGHGAFKVTGGRGGMTIRA